MTEFDDENGTYPGVARRHPASEENTGVPEDPEQAIHQLWGGHAELRESLRMVNAKLGAMQMEMRSLTHEIKSERRDNEDHRLSSKHARAFVSLCALLVVLAQTVQVYLKTR